MVITTVEAANGLFSQICGGTSHETWLAHLTQNLVYSMPCVCIDLELLYQYISDCFLFIVAVCKSCGEAVQINEVLCIIQVWRFVAQCWYLCMLRGYVQCRDSIAMLFLVPCQHVSSCHLKALWTFFWPCMACSCSLDDCHNYFCPSVPWHTDARPR